MTRPAAIALLLTAAGVVRIVTTWHEVSQTVDETPNIACGMQWLDQGRYDCGPFHPPLARIAISIGPYLYGARSTGIADRWKEGNAVLNTVRRPLTALKLARSGTLVFFLSAAVCVWFWARRLLGEWGAAASVCVFTSLPLVLGHSGIATTDMAVAAGVCAALYAFTRWLEDPTPGRAVLLGLAVAFAFLGKFSSIVSLSTGAVCILAFHAKVPRRAGLLALTAIVAFFTIWGAYRFSWGRIKEPIVDDATSQGGIMSHVPVAVLRAITRTPMPAPQILDGMWGVHEHNYAGHAAYLLGNFSYGGWWYFFPVALAVKMPIAFLVLCFIGLANWRTRVPAACALALLVACLPVRLNIGLRYLLPMCPLLAIVAGGAVVRLWQWRSGGIAAAALLAWLGASSLLAHPDYLAYFNEIARREPERFLVDSDLDWGQDVKRLCRRLKERKVQQVHLALHYSGDDTRLDLPPWEGLDPYMPVKGWVAVSFTRLKTYAYMVAQQQGRAEPAFAWLDSYQPVERVGKSILLYYIP